MEKRTLNGNFTKQGSSLHVGFIFKGIHPSTNIAELGGNSVHIWFYKSMCYKSINYMLDT